MLTSVCVRWHAGRASWRPAAELFEAAAFEVATIDSDTTARAFVVPAHYSHSYPAARRRFGLYTRRGALVGCAVFSAPTQASVLRPWSMADAVELGRLVLLDEVPGNAESWFVARCFEQLRREFAGVVSFSDPEPRTDAAARRDLLRATAALTYPKFNARACRVGPVTVNTTCTTRPT